MAERSASFGVELRRLRLAAGMTLARLAALVHYSTGYLSKIETGVKRPSPDLARRCDAVLGAGGLLAALVPVSSQARPAVVADDGEVWVMNLGADGVGWFRPVARRDAMVAGAASALALGLGARGAPPADGGAVPIAVFRSFFQSLRDLGQVAGPGVVLPTLIAQTHTLRTLAADADSRARTEFLVLAARYAEYAGWMAQESGDDRAALWWTDQAVGMAAAGGDRDLAAYALVRRGLVAFYRDDAAETIDLSRQAQGGAVPPRIAGLAAMQEAQGYALAGDYDSCRRCLDRSRTLLARATTDAALPVLGTGNLPDPPAMIEGWCLHDLGRPREAVTVLDRELAKVSAGAVRTRARYGVRRALAYAAAGEVDHACDLTGRLLDTVDAIGSETILIDLRRVARTLARFRSAAAVRALSPRLTASLRGSAL